MRFSPGDRVLLEGGQTFEGNFTLDEGSRTDPAAPILIGSYGRGRALIKAAKGTAIQVRNVGGIVIRDLKLEGESAGTNQGFGVEVVNERGAARLDLIRLENLEVSNFRWAGIYVGGVPTDLPAYRQKPGGRHGFRNVRISRCLAHEILYYGIYVSGPWNRERGGYANQAVTISDSVAYDNHGDPTYKANHSGNGIMLDDTDGGLIDHCTAYRNGDANGSQAGGPVGIWTDESNGVTIQFCESYGNRTGGAADGGGFDLDGGVTNSIMQYNYSHDNDGAGYLVWNYGGAIHPLSGNVIRYNISENDGRRHKYGGVHVGTSGEAVHGIEIYNNTIYATASEDGQPRDVWVGGTAVNKGINFRNNLFVSDAGVPLVEIEPNQTAVALQGNGYWANGGKFIILDKSGSFAALDEWRAATGQERLEGVATGIVADPRLTAMGGGETLGATRSPFDLAAYRLLPDSPLIDAGIDLGRQFGLDVGTQDFWGTPLPQGKGFDIGACEALGR
jgi:hypothetical protein